MGVNEKGNSIVDAVLSSFRLVTPILTAFALFVINDIKSDIRDVKSSVVETQTMVFKHLTNDEIHIPRGIVVTKAEHDAHIKYSEFVVSQVTKMVDSIKCDIADVKRDIYEINKRGKQL